MGVRRAGVHGMAAQGPQGSAGGDRPLPGLQETVSLDAGDPDAGNFAAKVNKFLGPIFGLKQEAT